VSSGRSAKTVGWLYSSPINRSDGEQVKQPNPVSVRSVVLRGWKSCVHVGGSRVTLNTAGATERVVTWPKPLNKVTASIKQNIEVYAGCKVSQTPMFNLLRCHEKSDLSRSRKEIGSSVPQDW